MNENSSKQVLLSILGIAVLVVAVVGVSFAFFSYSKTGLTNNVITTGEIYMYLTEGNTMTLTNAFPVKTDLTTTQDAADDIGKLTFSVTGKNTSNTDIAYKVYLVPGEAPSDAYGTEDLLKESEVSAIMTTQGEGITNKISAATPVVGLSQGLLIAESKIPADTEADVTHQYTINMYVNNTVKISDTDANVNGDPTDYCAHAKKGTPETTTATGNYGCELNKPVYSDMYFSAKVQVIGNTTAANIAPVVTP
ncbi:MAG: hypothetical protein IJ501_03280 [Bacilli bacterium]|nr:hypothetical protein [Bacilli bacterium]